MGDLSEHFSLHEFRCHCSDHSPQHCEGSSPISMDLIGTLQKLRDALERPILVHSGFRCIPWNRQCGGKIGSKHILGLAADIHVEGLNPKILEGFADTVQSFGGIGIYTWGIHVDMGPSGRRWDYSKEPFRDVIHHIAE